MSATRSAATVWDHPLYDVPQLTDIARPFALQEAAGRFLRQRAPGHSVLPAALFKEVIEQGRHVLPAFTKRRHVDPDDVEAVEQIFSERAGRDPFVEIAIGGRDDADIDAGVDTVSAHPLHFAGLDESEHERLQSRAHLSDFVKEQRAAVGALEEPRLVAICIRETASNVSEQFRFEERVGKPRAVDRDQSVLSPRAVLVNQMRHHLLADTCFAGNEHLRVAPARQFDVLANLADRLAGAYEYGFSHGHSFCSITEGGRTTLISLSRLRRTTFLTGFASRETTFRR